MPSRRTDSANPPFISTAEEVGADYFFVDPVRRNERWDQKLTRASNIGCWLLAKGQRTVP